MLAPRLMKKRAIDAIPLPDAVCSGVLADRRDVNKHPQGASLCEALIFGSI